MHVRGSIDETNGWYVGVMPSCQVVRAIEREEREGV